jgi:hypothetical protein
MIEKLKTIDYLNVSEDVVDGLITELVELPKEHELFKAYFDFPQGTPKIHEHDNKRPQTFAIFDDFGRIMVIYTYESNISDGWADYNTHKDSDQTREKALKFGTNILSYILTK